MLSVNRKLVMGHIVWLLWILPKEIVSNQYEKSVIFPRYTLKNGCCVRQLLSGLAWKVRFRGPVFSSYHLVCCKIAAEVAAWPNLVPVSCAEKAPSLCKQPEGLNPRGRRSSLSPAWMWFQESGCDLGPVSLPPCLILCAVMSWPKIAMQVILFKSTERRDDAAL